MVFMVLKIKRDMNLMQHNQANDDKYLSSLLRAHSFLKHWTEKSFLRHCSIRLLIKDIVTNVVLLSFGMKLILNFHINLLGKSAIHYIVRETKIFEIYKVIYPLR